MKIRTLCIAGAVAAAFLSFSAPATRAADMSSMSGIDYKPLIHPMWDYSDLQHAKTYGLTDSQVATVAKVSWMTGWSFDAVLAMVQRGESFGMISQKANLRLNDVMDSSEVESQIAAYKTAYEHSGKGAMMSGSM
ncbi:MAG: hypothetical protein ABIY70_19505 [Capsulimonas sp.]|uniref:hypothetical protein n=1 Tax=Capsulimonas sp. TaxID=2494211 RepID=UPI0032678123